jgi:hypothetical protein
VQRTLQDQDAKMFNCNFISQSGRAKDHCHHSLSKVLKIKESFPPFMVPDSMIFRGHGDPSSVSANARVKV